MKEALKKFLLDIDCLNELLPWAGKFNLFDVLRISRAEIRHSNMLAWLLNANENHGMGDSYVKALVQKLVANDSAGRYDVFQLALMEFLQLYSTEGVEQYRYFAHLQRRKNTDSI